MPADGNKTHHGPMRGDSPWLTFALAALPNCAIYRNPVQPVSVHISSYIPIPIYYPVVESTSCPSRVYTPIIRVPPVYFQGPTPSPLTQTPSTPKHTNPIQQSSRNRKAVIPSRQKNPTKTKTLPAFFFFSSLLLSKRHPHQCCVSLLHTARHTTLSPGCPPDSVRSRSPGILSCK